jgi:chromosome partitioning protein
MLKSHMLDYKGSYMTKIVVNATHKGGEGKTTNSIMLAEYCALVLELRTLIIDLDPQANFSGRYVKMEYDPANKGGKIPPIHPDYEPAIDKDWNGISGIANIFYGEEAIPYPTAIEKLELLPAHSMKLQEAEAVTKNEVLEKVHLQLKRFLDLGDVRANYDVIIIDTPPSKGPLTIAAIKAATHLVIPAQMEQFSIEGILGMLQLWKQESYSRAKDNQITLVGILPNQLRDVKVHKEFLADLKTKEHTKKFMMSVSIKKRTIYTEILTEEANPKSIFDLPASNVARMEYEKACRYIMERVLNHG